VDAQTGTWLQSVADPGARQAVTFAANNHIFTPVQVTAATVSDPSTDKTLARRSDIEARAASPSWLT